MNERIKELAEQATSYKEVLVEGKHDIEVFDKEKFAELIVRECAQVASDYDGAHYVGTVIEEHFGVKE